MKSNRGRFQNFKNFILFFHFILFYLFIYFFAFFRSPPLRIKEAQFPKGNRLKSFQYEMRAIFTERLGHETLFNTILPFPYTSAPALLRLPVPHVSTKSLKSSLSSHAKILFYIWNERIKYCKRYHYEVNRSVLHVNC